LPVLAYGVGLAICLARPTHFLTLTRVGDDWPTVHDRVTYFRKCMRRAGCHFEWAYHVERNPQLTGAHIHAWARGDLPHAAVTTAALQAGMGRMVDLRQRSAVSVHNPDRGVVESLRYGMKAVGQDGAGDGSLVLGRNVTGSAFSETGLTVRADDYLALNGHRIVHTSKNFWLDRFGHPTTLKAARSDARALKRRDQPLRFSARPRRRPADGRPAGRC
jgi:hypothetical protein